MTKRSLLLVVVLFAAACVGTAGGAARVTVVANEIEAKIADAFARARDRVAAAEERVEERLEPEPYVLRRRVVRVGDRWGADARWLSQAVVLFSQRLDLEAQPRGTPLSVWTLGPDLVAAELHRSVDDGGPILAMPAFVPPAKRPRRAPPDTSARISFFDETGASLDGPFLARPVDYRYVSSRFGLRVHPFSGTERMHRGVDYSAPAGDPVVSVGDGTVVAAGANRAAGIFVVVRHRHGLRTKYFHLDGLGEGVRAGARVKRGQLIGWVGATGMATGPHLHFEVLANGIIVDPTAIEWPAAVTLPKQQLEEHKALADRLRAMAPDDELFTWSDPIAPAAPAT